MIRKLLFFSLLPFAVQALSLANETHLSALMDIRLIYKGNVKTENEVIITFNIQNGVL